MALQQFQLGLTIYQGRTNMLLGAARAARSAGDHDAAQRYVDKLLASWADAEADHPFKNEASEALSSNQ